MLAKQSDWLMLLLLLHLTEPIMIISALRKYRIVMYSEEVIKETEEEKEERTEGWKRFSNAITQLNTEFDVTPGLSGSWKKAHTDTHSPGTEVPRATNTTAVTESFRPMVHPKWDARSPVTAVNTPMSTMDTKKQAQPFQYSVGGTKANRTFQKTVRKCMM